MATRIGAWWRERWRGCPEGLRADVIEKRKGAAMTEATVARLADLTVLDGAARVHRLGDCWAGHAVVLVLVRHFGCLFCKQQVSELAKETDRIHALGAELVVVGNGGAEHVRWFEEDFGIETPVFTDSTGEAYRTVGAKRGFFSGANPLTTLASLRAFASGYRQSGTRGDRYQQGGVFVIGPDGSMPYRYLSRYAGDHPAPQAVVAALERATRIAT